MVGIIHIAIGNLQCEQFYYKGLLAYRQFCFLSNFVDSCRSEKVSGKTKKARLKRTFLHHDNHGKYGVGDGIRTHDLRDHNPTL